jgi:hypothetical protein
VCEAAESCACAPRWDSDQCDEMIRRQIELVREEYAQAWFSYIENWDREE